MLRHGRGMASRGKEEEVSAEEKWKRKYFRMRRLAARLVRELRRVSPEGAEVAERRLAAIAGHQRGGDSE